MKTPKALYVLISIFCVFAIIAGVYSQFFEKRANNGNLIIGENKKNTITEESLDTIKEKFGQIFTNTINLNGFDDSNISKINSEKAIVYTAYDLTKNETSYEMNIKVPVVNIKNEVGNSFNTLTQSIFVNKANQIISSTNQTSKTIYRLEYTAYVNDNILSVVIRSNLKEGTYAQRVMVQTYNYNLTTGQNVTLNELIQKKLLDRNDVEKKIKSVVTEADNQSKTIQNAGYSVDFSRDLSSSIYSIEKTTTFFLGENGKLYIIYAYGNQNYTSEMDVVLFE